MRHAIDPKIDCVFKALLGAEENRNLLIHFLNAFLAGELLEPIVWVDILNPYNEKEFLSDKLSIVDVKAKDGHERIYQIEIQLTSYSHLPARIIYNWADIYSQQLKSGQDYGELRPTYAIWLLAENLITDDSDYVHHYKVRDEQGKTFTQHGGIWLLELEYSPPPEGVSNSVIQYCLSYNNQGAGIGLFEFGAAKPWENNTVRYNVSQNDGLINAGSLAVWRNEAGGTMRNCEIYNNTFYNDTIKGLSLWIYNNWPGFHFRNNIFVYSGSFLFPGQKLADEVFQANCYWNLSGNTEIAGHKSLAEWAAATGNEMMEGNIVGFYADPQLQAPGSCTLTEPDKLTPENLAAYSLKSGSPLIDRGLDLKNLFSLDPGGRDLVGTVIPQGNNFDIGALERSK